MLFNKSGRHPSTSTVTASTAMPPPPRITSGAARSNSNSSIASSIGSVSSLNLNSTSGSTKKTPLATSSTNNVKEAMAAFNNIEASNSKGSNNTMPLIKSNYNQDAKLSYKNSYAENKAMLASKFRSAKQDTTPMKGVEQRNLLSEKSDTENGVPIPSEVSVKPEVLTKPETFSANTVVVFAKPANVAEQRRIDGYVGFANCPNQIYRKSVKRGFEFTLMVVGESGLGKSTFMNSLFFTNIYSSEYPGPSNRLKKTINVETTKVMLKESSVNLQLTVVDTPGFGDAIDNSNCWNPVLNFVEAQYEMFMNAETRVNRIPVQDTRVHACLYFIAPSGHGLKPLDVEFMRKLQDKVNIIPVIGKADALTPEEISDFKERINRQIAEANIRVYQPPEETFPVGEEDDKKDFQRMSDYYPFAVVGSNTVIEHQGLEARRTRGRRYPWGVVDIENPAHSDFVPLRNMLIRNNLLDLIEVTNNVLYENFRCRKLAGAAGMTLEKIPNKNPLATLEEEKNEHKIKIQKMEKEMEEVFQRKVSEKTSRLEASQLELETKLKESQEKTKSMMEEIEAERKAFMEEKKAWEELNGVNLDDWKPVTMDTLDVGTKKKTLANSISFRMGR